MSQNPSAQRDRVPLSFFAWDGTYPTLQFKLRTHLLRFPLTSIGDLTFSFLFGHFYP